MPAVTSRRPPIERGDGDAEGLGEIGGSFGGNLGGASLDSPNLQTGGAEPIGERLPTQLLGGANLLDPLSHQRTFGTHSNSVSETETLVQTFQTRKRKTAITLPAVANLLLPDMETFEQWARQMNVSWTKVLEDADVADPREGSRASKSRLAKGGAPRVRKQLLETLLAMERARKTHTEIGTLILSLDEWRRLGGELAALDAGRFRVLLDALRKDVAVRRVEAESPFFDHESKPR